MLRAMGAQASLARLEGAYKNFGNIAALAGLNLEVKRGELLALVGPNGAGKSTAISLLLGLQRPDRGSAALFGEDPQSIDARRRIGLMMQEINLSPVMRPREFITQTASYYPSPYETTAVIKRLGIEKIADRPYGSLSGGQKRQAQFGMAICGRPELLFLDEPTVGLDVQSRGALWQVVRDLIHEGCSIILTTHYLEEAEALADRVAVIDHGKLVAAGTVEEIRAHESRKSIVCRSSVAIETMRAWPGVLQVTERAGRQQIVTQDAETVLRQLLGADSGVRDIEVRAAGLGDALAALTSEDPSGRLQ